MYNIMYLCTNKIRVNEFKSKKSLLMRLVQCMQRHHRVTGSLSHINYIKAYTVDSTQLSEFIVMATINYVR